MDEQTTGAAGPVAGALEAAVAAEEQAAAEVAGRFCDAAEALIAEEPEVAERSAGAAAELVAAWTGNPAAEGERAVRCDDCRAAHEGALLREVALRHDAEGRRDEALGELRRAFEERSRAEDERDEAIAERDQALGAMSVALAERDARILDEQWRAKRIDIERLRAKVELMRKNLAAVDARADERYAEHVRATEGNCAAKVREAQVACAERIAAVRAEEQQAAAALAGVRRGEAARLEALQDALGAIWAFDRRERGAARTERDLRVQLTQLLSAAFALPQ